MTLTGNFVQQNHLRLRPVLLTVFSLFSLIACRKEPTESERRDEAVRSVVSLISSDSLRADVQWLQNMGTRFTLSGNRRNVAVKIRNRFISMGYDGAKLDSFYLTVTFKGTSYSLWQYNVLAYLEGSQYPDSACVVGGHYDDYVSSGDPFTSAPGAHDNASGTSAVLEIARVLKLSGFSPAKTILFVAFGAEELGLYGSSDFAADPGVYAGKISFMLNHDMIAYEPSVNSSGWRVNIMDYDNSHLLRKDASRATLNFTSLNSYNDNTFNRYSDSYPFSLNGYKALFFYSGSQDPYYHTGNDVVSNLNFDYCSEVVSASCALLAEKNFRLQ